ncbi:MAG: hypothetical protein MI799_11090 [Desulfobacterales bacterium]|nr:hypothetical protein [Desulfobacterales bacterium]
MDIKEYLLKLKAESQNIFNQSLAFQDDLGKAHHFSACIYEFADNINDQSEKDILIAVSSQLEAATLNACFGMYRQAFASLRLSLEMGLGAVHFSIHKLELQEWIDGRADIKWASLIDENNGILSVRFAKAFFPEFSKDILSYRKKTSSMYRKLSEFVHGNNETWGEKSLKLSYDDKLLKFYFEKVVEVSEVILYVLSCRYLKSFSKKAVESLEFIPEEMNHLSYIRDFFGGPSV